MKTKRIQYLFPNIDKANSLKIFQDKTSNIVGFYFTKDSMRDVMKLENSKNYAIYFLFNENAEEDKKLYVGQTVQGIDRMKDHDKTKGFWSYGIMFTTDNNSFDKLAIDYLEYYFINKIETESSYILENKDKRLKKPNISLFDEPDLNKFANQIEFLLKTERIVLEESKASKKDKLYLNKEKTAAVYFKNGKFILQEGSYITGPVESTKNWSDGGTFYNKYKKIIEGFIANDKVEIIEGKIRLKTNIEVNSPSRAGDLCTGRSTNGWSYFVGIEELRK